MLILEGSNSTTNFLLASTAGREIMQQSLPAPRAAPATRTSASQIQKRQISHPLLQTTMAAKEMSKRALHLIISALPLATTAEQECFIDADRSGTSRSSHQLIEEGGAAAAPASLQPQEQKKGEKQPYHGLDPATEIHATASTTGHTPKPRHEAENQQESLQI
jgi:hypothetical protein